MNFETLLPKLDLILTVSVNEDGTELEKAHKRIAKETGTRLLGVMQESTNGSGWYCITRNGDYVEYSDLTATKIYKFKPSKQLQLF